MITIDEVKNRLNSLGYSTDDNDTFALKFLIGKVENHIKHFCNIREIPECLNYVVIDMTIGEFLQEKRANGQLDIEPIVKKIQDGDTTVEYASGVDSESIFNAYVNKLLNGYEGDLIAHRCIVW